MKEYVNKDYFHIQQKLYYLWKYNNLYLGFDSVWSMLQARCCKNHTTL